MGFSFMLLLSNILLIACLSTAKGSAFFEEEDEILEWFTGQLCDFPQFKYGHLYDEERWRHYFPVPTGNKYRYYCDNGFSPPSGHSWDYLYCTAQGWEPEVPCIRQCVFHYVENGQSSYWEKIYIQGQSVKVQCYNGYSLQNGQDTMTCTENGWSPPPKCIHINRSLEPSDNPSCSGLLGLDDHSMLELAGWNVHQASKNIPEDPAIPLLGIHPEDVPTETCSVSDIEIENGFFSESFHTYALNRETSYRCKQGYVTNTGETSGSITCLQNGWSPQPSCIKSCERPVFENSVTMNTRTWFKLNDKLDYECLIGYENEHKHTKGSITCTYYGWSDTPSCYERECSVPPLDPKLVVSPRKEKYRVGDLLEFSCCSGHRVGPDSVQCYHFGWSPSFPICKAGQVASCAQPPEIPNGEINGTKRVEYSHGEVVEYDCKPRFLLKGPNKIQCVDGKWTTLPVCVEEERTCGDIPELEHGSAKFSAPPYHHGDSVEFTCAETFTMIGHGSVSCISGKWTQLPQCVATNQLEKCRALKSTAIEAIIPNRIEFNHNSIMNYKCRDKQEYEHSICINGIWDPEPNCISRISCPPPPQIPNSQVIETTVKYLDGEKLSVLCQDNFLTQDSEEMVCKDGRWQSLPHCTDSTRTCGPPPPIDNGDITSLSLPEYEPLSSVDYQCQKYYVLKGKKTITCRNGKWSEPPTCLHACVIPEVIMERHNIILRWRENKKVYIQSGEDIEFACKPRYREARGSPPFLTKCINGHINYPTCV